MNNINDLKTAQEQLKQLGGNLLGSIISWKVNPNICISWKLFQQLLQLNSIPEQLHPSKKSYPSAFKKAIAKCRKLLPEGFLLRYIRTEEENITVGVVSEKIDSAQELLEYNCAATIKLENEIISDKLIDSGNLAEADFNLFMSEFGAEVDKQLETTAEDIRVVLRKFTTKFCVRINPHGGGYFCPSFYQDLLNSIKQFTNDADPEKASLIYCFELFNSPQNQNDMGIVVQESLEDEIKSLKEEIKAFLEEEVSGKRLQNGLEIREKKIKELSARVGVFKNILEFKGSDLESTLEELKSSLCLNPLQKEIKELEENYEQNNGVNF